MGLVLGGADLGWIQGWQVTKRHISRLAYTTCLKHEHLKPIGTRKGFVPLESKSVVCSLKFKNMLDNL